MNPSISQALGANNQQITQAQQAAASYQPQVSSDVAGTNAAQGNLQAYQQSLQAPQNQLGNIYGQNLQSQYNTLGINPQELQGAQNVLAQTQNVMAALPQATQQATNGYMVTGAQEANRYSQAVAPLQQQLTNQGNAVTALQSGVGLAQNAANQQTTLQGQSQQQQLGALQNLYQDALSKQQQAQSQVQYFSTLQQQGYQVDASLNSAQAAYNQAAATAAEAAAQMVSSQAQMGQLTLLQNAATSANQLKINQAASEQPGLKPGQNPQSQVSVPAAPAMASFPNPFGVGNGATNGILGYL